MMNQKYTILFLLLMGIFLTACGNSKATPSAIEVTSVPADAMMTIAPENSGGADVAYPEPPESAYPSPANYDVLSAYPETVDNAVVQSSESGLIPFQITKPVYAGDTQVTGTGTPGIPLMLVNVIMVGELMGETVVQDDGTFTFDIQALDSGIRIGVILGNLEGTAWSPEDFYDSGYYGDDARVVPLVGFLYDTALVEDK